MRTLTNLLAVAIIGLASLTGVPVSARADEAAATKEAVGLSEEATPPATKPGEDKWVFNSPLYLWALGMNGTVEVNGNSERVSLPFNEAVDHTDLGFMGYFELAKPQYGFYVQPNYSQLSFDGKIGGLKSTYTCDLWIIEMAGFYRIWEHGGEWPAALYAIGGARYWNIHNNIKLKNPLGSTSTADGDWLLDPIMGIRFQQYVTKRLHIQGQTDLGGFGLSQQTSRFTWQLMGTVGYDFTMPVVKFPSTVFGGWRQINDQHTQGGNGYNLTFSGVLLGLNCRLF